MNSCKVLLMLISHSFRLLRINWRQLSVLWLQTSFGGRLKTLGHAVFHEILSFTCVKTGHK